MFSRVATIHRHTQEAAASEWTIVHNLQTYPVIDVYSDVGGVMQKVIPSSVVYIDDNTCKVTFSTPRSGFATVI